MKIIIRRKDSTLAATVDIDPHTDKGSFTIDGTEYLVSVLSKSPKREEAEFAPLLAASETELA